MFAFQVWRKNQLMYEKSLYPKKCVPDKISISLFEIVSNAMVAIATEMGIRLALWV